MIDISNNWVADQKRQELLPELKNALFGANDLFFHICKEYMFADLVTQTPSRIQRVEKIKSRSALLQPTLSFCKILNKNHSRLLYYSDLDHDPDPES